MSADDGLPLVTSPEATIANIYRLVGLREIAPGVYSGPVLVSRAVLAAMLWRGGQTTVATNAAFTLTVGVDTEEIRHTGTLTAARAVTLSTTNAYAGARFRISRSGGGAFSLNVGTGPLAAMGSGTWAEFVYNGSAWYLAGYGSLGP